MRKIIFFAFCLIIAVITITSCKEKTPLEKTVAEWNSNCPWDVLPGITRTSVELEGEQVVMYFRVDETKSEYTLAELNSLVENDEGFMMLWFLQSLGKTGGDFLEICQDAKVGVTARFVSKSTDMKADIVVTPMDMEVLSPLLEMSL